MDKSIRCTICTWRGTIAEASAVRVQAAPLPPQLEEIQRAYEEKQARAVSVDSAAILEALRHLYRAGPLARELADGAMSQ